MTSLAFKFNKSEQRQLLRAMKIRPGMFFRKVKELWTQSDNITLGEIIRNQLSGRKGRKALNRISGNAARALNVKVQKLKRNVISTIFLLRRGGVDKYLPIHDKSWTGSRVIRAKNKPYLVFKMQTSTRAYSKKGKRLKRPQKGFSWVKVKQVTIPQRTNILEYYIKQGGKRRAQDVREAMRLTLNG